MNVLPRARRRTWVASGLTGVLTAGVVFALVVGPSVVIAAPARAADVASSAVTVTAKDQDPAGYQDAPFPDLAVTVSQTKILRQQGVSVSWTGATGHASLPFTSSNGGRWFLQIFQCWGDDPTDPQRPDRTTCQYGGTAKYGATRDATRRYEYDAIPEKDKQYSVPRVSSFEGAYTSIPFVSRKGTVVSSITTAADGTKSRDLSVDVNNNTQFDANTTNEIRWAGSGADGTGSLSFEMQTTMQSPALGCGDPVTVDGSVEGASCWLVILPRPNADNGSSTINQSGLFWDSWKHALAVRIGFEPVGARCTVGAPERQLAAGALRPFRRSCLLAPHDRGIGCADGGIHDRGRTSRPHVVPRFGQRDHADLRADRALRPGGDVRDRPQPRSLRHRAARVCRGGEPALHRAQAHSPAPREAPHELVLGLAAPRTGSLVPGAEQPREHHEGQGLPRHQRPGVGVPIAHLAVAGRYPHAAGAIGRRACGVELHHGRP